MMKDSLRSSKLKAVIIIDFSTAGVARSDRYLMDVEASSPSGIEAFLVWVGSRLVVLPVLTEALDFRL